MGSEMLLYGYGAVCLSMLVFNIVYNIVMKGSSRRLERRSGRLAERIEGQLFRISRGGSVEEKHIVWLQRKLSHISSLIAFDRVMEEWMTRDGQAEIDEYRRQLQPVILHLAMIYRKRDNMQAAYFAYFLSRHKLHRHMSVDTVQRILVGYMEKDSLYCRINALQALYQFGTAENIAEALIILDRSGSFFHEKILTDGLLSFTGDHEQLMGLLWERFEQFSDRMRLAVLNYIRFKSGDYCERMLAIMTDETADKELRLSAIRYFGRYEYQPALKPLLDFARDKDPVNWEYEAISLTSLASYSGEEVIRVLMDAMHSSNWYVRRNAAVSLESHDLDYTDLIEIVSGRDRYAREMMMYHLDARRIKAEGKEART